METTTSNPVLLLPAMPGLLTTMRNLRKVKWEPHGGFTVHELGQRLRAGDPYEMWMREADLKLVSLGTDEHGEWFEICDTVYP